MAQLPEYEQHCIKILSVVWYKVLPPKFGGQKAVAVLNEHLGELSPLYCLCSRANNAEAGNYAVYPSLPMSKGQFLNPFVWISIYQFARQKGITHLLLEFPYHGIAAIITKRLLGIKLCVHQHNIEYQRFREQKKWWWRLLLYYERWVLRNADLVFFKTAADRQLAVTRFGLLKDKTSLLPYGVAAPTPGNPKKIKSLIREQHGIQTADKLLLFAGTLDYAPNAEAVLTIKNKLLPLLSNMGLPFKIIVCGRNHLSQFQLLNELTDSQLIMAGEVEDIDAYFAAADVFINPVLTGGGVQTKIFDALSYDLNVVCFRSKAIGIELADNKIFGVEDGNWQQFAEATVVAMKRQVPTPKVFFDRYNWRSITAEAHHKIRSA